MSTRERWAGIAFAVGEVVAIYALLVWLGRDDSTDARVPLLYGVARACQHAALVLGQWGLQAELRCHQLLEAERMI